MKVGTRFAANGIVNSYDTVNTTSSGEWKWTARHCLNSLIAKSAKDPESSKESKQWEVMPESLPIPDCWNCLPTLQLIHSLLSSTQSMGPCLSTDRHISSMISFIGFRLLNCLLADTSSTAIGTAIDSQPCSFYSECGSMSFNRQTH